MYFEIAGSIGNHIESIATYVMYHIAESKTDKVLLDLRNATGLPDTAKLFTHVLKYPPMSHINCALIGRERTRDCLLLYEKLMRHRGHTIHLFGNIDDGTAWLLRGRESQVETYEQSLTIPRRIFESVLQAWSVRPRARNEA